MTIDTDLARRLETADILGAADYAHTLNRLEPGAGASVLEVGGGFAVLMGLHFPINRIGNTEFSDLSESALSEAEESCVQMGVSSRLTFCPLGRGERLSWLGARGYRLGSFFNNWYVREVRTIEPEIPEGVEVREAAKLEDWVEASHASWGFPHPVHSSLFAQVALQRPRAHSFIAWAEGKPVAVAGLSFRDGLALLNGAATAPAYRGRGIQRALLETRLALAAREGCALAAVAASPGSQSARNIERLGFRLAYTRLTLEKLPQRLSTPIPQS
jgi:GNAT superfamily N-acetyltransferase